MNPEKFHFLETSVLLRFVFGEAGGLSDLNRKSHLIASELIRLEALRTIDRMRIRQNLSSREVAYRMGGVSEVLKYVEMISIQSFVLERASVPFPVPLGTLDAIHLASALLWKQSERKNLIFLTHNLALARAATALGLDVEG